MIELNIKESTKDLWKTFSLHIDPIWIETIIEKRRVAIASLARKVGVPRYQLVAAMNGNAVLPRNANITIKLLYSSLTREGALNEQDMHYVVMQLLKKYGSYKAIEQALKLHHTTIYDWRDGQMLPSQESVKKILEALKITLEDA